MKELAARIRAGDRNFTDEEFDIFAECLDRCPPRKPHEMVRLRDGVVAQHVTIIQVVGGVKKEAAIADAQEKFLLVRSQVTTALKKNAENCKALKTVLNTACAKISSARQMHAISRPEDLSNFLDQSRTAIPGTR